MTKHSDIKTISDKISFGFAPEKIILFGSFAWGKPDNDSDIDLLVVLQHNDKPWMAASKIREFINTKIPLDIMVRTPEELEKRLSLNDSFISDIISRGKILYEA